MKLYFANRNSARNFARNARQNGNEYKVRDMKNSPHPSSGYRWAAVRQPANQ